MIGLDFWLQLLVVLICLFYGARKGGMALGLLGGVGLPGFWLRPQTRQTPGRRDAHDFGRGLRFRYLAICRWFGLPVANR